MDTNLITAKIILIAVTNWVTVSRTIPVLQPHEYLYAVARFDTLHQQGWVSSNLVAQVEWKGKTNQVTLETVWSAGAPLSKDVLDGPDLHSVSGGIILAPNTQSTPLLTH